MSTSTLAFSGSSETIDGLYNRSFVLRDVYRNSDDDIVASTTGGATVDGASFWVEVTVDWGSESVSSETMLGNIFNQ